MDNKSSEGSVNRINAFNKKTSHCHVESVLHQNVQSLKKRVLELDALLQTELSYVNVLCFTEHRQKEQQIVYMNFMQFKQANSVCRVTSDNGGACIYVKKCLETNEVTYFQDMNKEKTLKWW
jgi:hypothetical protein